MATLTRQAAMADLACERCDRRYTARDYLDAGVSVSELFAAGVSVRELLADGVPVRELFAAGVSVRELLADGVSVREMLADGVPVRRLLADGVSVQRLLAGDVPQEHREQLAAIIAALEAIPVIPDIYTRMLAAIESGERTHDQSTFGPGSDPGDDLCGTPMCTAGHLIDLCGPAGYALLEACDGDHEAAAQLIHRRMRPDVPAQNYGAIPQAWAIAYIRKRAAEAATKGVM